MDIKPVETIYNGYRFRSRLEARWAVFFDALGVDYEYEPEGYELVNGERYLPDFRVKCYGKRGDKESDPFDLYIEVKGVMTAKDARKIRLFSGINDEDLSAVEYAVEYAVDRPVLVVTRMPPEGHCTDSWKVGAYDQMILGYEIYPFNYFLIDGDYFAAYPAADSNGHFYLMGDDSNYVNEEDLPRIEAAYRKARQARFEYGETPNGRRERH